MNSKRSSFPLTLAMITSAHTAFAFARRFDDDYIGLSKLNVEDGISEGGGTTIISGTGTGEAPNTVGEGSIDGVEQSQQQAQAENAAQVDDAPKADASETGTGAGKAIIDPPAGSDQPS